MKEPKAAVVLPNSPLFDQFLLDTHDELIVDLFAGGGGASSGIEQSLGRQVDVAINHNSIAVSLHTANHPQTKHYVSDVFEVDPREVTKGRPVGLMWASPDCTFHSKARGGKPIRSKTKKRRALAWVVKRWAGQARPRVIVLENVEEFAQWGPLIGKPDELRPCPKRRGRTFRRFVRSLELFDYRVEWRELKACDYGAPTIRKRLFLIARCDGLPIVWPEPTHGPGRRMPYRTAAECIDWSLPMCSIFATKEEAKAWGKAHGQPSPVRPLAENSLRRIARGVKRYVLDNPKPFIVNVANSKTTGRAPNVWDPAEPLRTIATSCGFGAVAPILNAVTHQGERRTPTLEEPVPTVTCTQRGELSLVAPFLTPRYGEAEGQAPRALSVEAPMPTVVNTGNGASLVAANIATYYGAKREETRGINLNEPLHVQGTENRHSLIASFLAQNNGGFFEGPGHSVEDPVSTVTANSSGHFGLLAAHIQRDFGQSVGSDGDEPIGTITSGGLGKAAIVASFIDKYYGNDGGQLPTDPLHTVPTVDRFSLVTVNVEGEPYVIVDIGMRMLQPRELYRAQGFRDGYIIDRGAAGEAITKTEQVRMVGNSVCPPVAEAIVRANLPAMIVRTPNAPKKSKRRAVAGVALFRKAVAP